MLTKVFMDGDTLFHRVRAVCLKERSEIVRVDMYGRSSVRQSDERVES